MTAVEHERRAAGRSDPPRVGRKVDRGRIRLTGQTEGRAVHPAVLRAVVAAGGKRRLTFRCRLLEQIVVGGDFVGIRSRLACAPRCGDDVDARVDDRAFVDVVKRRVERILRLVD